MKLLLPETLRAIGEKSAIGQRLDEIEALRLYE